MPESTATQAAAERAATDRSTLIGVAAALATVTIWASWILATRYGVTTSLGVIDIAFLRFAVASVLLAPVLLTIGLIPTGKPIGRLLLIAFGPGAAFVLLASGGMAFAPPAAIGALLPSTLPLWTALVAFFLNRERLDPLRRLGLALIAAGVALALAPILIGPGESGISLGALLLPAASGGWALYTVALRQSALSPLQAAALANVWSLAVMTPLWLAFGRGFAGVPTPELVYQAVQQGLISGVAALFTYAIAVRRLGATGAAAFAAFTPVLVTLGGWAVLAEIPTVWGAAAALTASLGVLFASGVLRRSAVPAGQSARAS